MENPMFIIGVTVTGAPLPCLDYELRMAGGDWGASYFGLKYFRNEQLAHLRKDVAMHRNMFIRTNLRGGKFLKKLADQEGWNTLGVIILPENMSTLYRGKMDAHKERLLDREMAYINSLRSFDKRIIFRDAKSCAQELFREWSVANESLVV